MTVRSALYVGSVMHRGCGRAAPAALPVFWLLLDLDELPRCRRGCACSRSTVQPVQLP